MKEMWVCRCGLVDISKCEKRKQISNYFACQEITQTELGGNFSSSICDAKRFVEATIPSLTAALEELGGGWQPIETAPKDGTEIIVWWPEIGHPYITKWTRFINGNLYRDGWHCGIWEVERPTHWMPSPKPPKE